MYDVHMTERRYEIEILGRTRGELYVTDAQVRMIQREIESVRRNVRRMADWTVSWDEATEIAERTESRHVHTKIGNRALRMKLRIK